MSTHSSIDCEAADTRGNDSSERSPYWNNTNDHELSTTSRLSISRARSRSSSPSQHSLMDSPREYHASSLSNGSSNANIRSTRTKLRSDTKKDVSEETRARFSEDKKSAWFSMTRSRKRKLEDGSVSQNFSQRSSLTRIANRFGCADVSEEVQETCKRLSEHGHRTTMFQISRRSYLPSHIRD
jgi:hypothetical protein